jgi:Na+-transporting NADH:ubiquinone oxidoreductase subunit A
VIRISKGLDLPISGSPSLNISDEPKVSNVALLSNDFVGMKPTMLFKEGDHVKGGEKIFEDKKNIGVSFTSPGSGIIRSINRGDKRKFISIEIELDKDEDLLEFDTSQSFKDLLINSGLWNNRTPNVNDKPNAIFINCCDTNPLSVDPFNIINYDQELFNLGLNAVCNEFNCDIYVSYQNDQFIRANDSVIYNQFSGPHPSGLTSTHISILNPVNINKIVWTLNYQDIISFGYLLKNKILRTTKIISLAGPSVFEPSLIKARINGNIDQITAGKVDANSRIISGSVLHGHKSDGVMNYLGFYDSQISAIPDEVNEIFMNWLMPGSNLHSKLNVFLSSFVKPKEFIFNTSIGGGNRAIVPINSYEEVIPMDILVTQLLKSLVVADTEMAIDLGMLELIPEDLALCSYVCPSKYDYSSILMDNLNKVYSEL